VVAETVVSPKEVALESLSYTASEVVGGEGWVEPRAQRCPKAVVCPKAEEVALESLSYTASEVVGGEGWVEPRAQGCPKAVVCPKAEEWCG
jgi:hypothetical protein